MNPIQTGIAIALAVIVVGLFFIFPGLLPVGISQEGTASALQIPGQIAETGDTSGMQNEPTELQVTDVTVGTGATVVAGDEITAHYVGMLADGTVFDASANHGGPATFSIGVGQVILGWDQGIIGMKEGGKRKLVIPSALAYGAQGIAGVIPPNSTLIFEVELVKVTHPK